MTESAVTLVFVTAPSHDVAEGIVRAMVEERLAACGNIIAGITSIYRWEEAVQQEGEVLIIFKTTRAAVAGLSARVEEMHPYDVPEVLAVPVSAGLESYAGWVAANVRG